MSATSWESAGLEVLRQSDFSGTRLQRPGEYAVCFGAVWCPVTRRFMPRFVAQREKIPGVLAIADITDLESPLWDTFRIKITPTILFFHDGAIRARLDGKRFIGITAGALSQFEKTVIHA